MKLHLYKAVCCAVSLLILYRATNNFQYDQAEDLRASDGTTFPHGTVEARPGMELKPPRLATDGSNMKDLPAFYKTTLPHGIVEARSDLELKPLWSTEGSNLKTTSQDHQYLLAIPVGIRQKMNVNLIIRKFIPENFSIVLFHYDGDANDWDDYEWSHRAIHIVAQNQTKWWFAKRFLHPDVVSLYDYIFLWGEDLGVENFDPQRYLSIVKSESLEISQPALDPYLSSEVHHSITMRRKKGVLHKRIHSKRWNSKCSNYADEPPCTGWVEGTAPVFSRSAWHCVWHLIQDNLIHGWRIDMKLGYCIKGDPRKRVGIIDSEYVIPQGIRILGGSSEQKARAGKTVDVRVESKKQAKSELGIFQDRSEQATREDKYCVDPLNQPLQQQQQQQQQQLSRPANGRKPSR